jgi:hypothetical protein
MGDIAVSELEPIAKSGNLKAIDDLYRIGTPNAAKALISLLWDKDIEIAVSSAWRLASLIANPDIERNIDYVQFSNQAVEKHDETDWIWKPFETLTLPATSTIVRRVAYLINTKDIATPKTILRLDPRLAIPTVLIFFELSQKIKSIQTDTTVNNFIVIEHILREKDLKNTPDIQRVNLVINKLKERDFENKTEIIDHIINSLKHPHIEYMLKGTSPDLSLAILEFSLLGMKEPTKSDWVNVTTPVEYDFSHSWHLSVMQFLSNLLILITGLFFTIILVLPTIGSGIKGTAVTLLSGVVMMRIFFNDQYSCVSFCPFFGDFLLIPSKYNKLFNKKTEDSLIYVAIIGLTRFVIFIVISTILIFTTGLIGAALTWIIVFGIYLALICRGLKWNKLATNPLRELYDGWLKISS